MHLYILCMTVFCSFFGAKWKYIFCLDLSKLHCRSRPLDFFQLSILWHNEVVSSGLSPPKTARLVTQIHTHKHTFIRGMQPYMPPTGTKPFSSSPVRPLLTFFLPFHYVDTSHSFICFKISVLKSKLLIWHLFLNVSHFAFIHGTPPLLY